MGSRLTRTLLLIVLASAAPAAWAGCPKGLTAIIYDSSDKSLEKLAGHYGYTSAGNLRGCRRVTGVTTLSQLRRALDALAQENAGAVKKLFLLTHGDEGELALSMHTDSEESMKSAGWADFADKGYEKAFAPGAEIHFQGCKLGGAFRGRAFLARAAWTLLGASGGWVYGYPDDGLYLDLGIGTTDVHHSAKAVVYYIEPGSEPFSRDNSMSFMAEYAALRRKAEDGGAKVLDGLNAARAKAAPGTARRKAIDAYLESLNQMMTNGWSLDIDHIDTTSQAVSGYQKIIDKDQF